MALLTPVTLGDATRVAHAHGLGACDSLVGVEAGSVNTNYFIDTAAGRRFLRVYEEQEAEGVAYEWALLEHLNARGVPVPRRVPGPGPGECRVAGKCSALFELAPGEERCHEMWTPAHVEQTGRWLGRAHMAARDFGWRKASRFNAQGVRQRLAQVAEAGRPELSESVRRLREASLQAERDAPRGLPRGVVHGDLFRDNLRFEGETLACILDWESAADGPLVLDLAVALLALTYGDAFRWDEARALIRAYTAERALTDAEWLGLRPVAMDACVRFATTRMQDFYLRAAAAGTTAKRDYGRFLARMDALASLSNEDLANRLGR